ncbi:hypothetical protein SEVIR_6G110250v4 [Setaria viridis]|nr:uncharacterized protein LOC117862106 [Setaria viridis]
MHADGERSPEGHGTIWGRTTMERRCLRCHRYRTCSVLDRHHSRRHVLQCAPRRLHSLSQGNSVVQQNPYFEQRHSACEIPESSNIQDLHQCYDYQQFGQQLGEPVPMSIGTNVVGRNHDGSQDGMLMLTQSSGAHSGGLQKQRDMFNWSNSSLQMGHQTQLNLSSVTGAPSGGLHQQKNMFSRRNTSLQTPPQAHLNLSSAPGRSSVVTGVPLGGPEQHRNMMDWNDISVEMLRQAQLNFYSGRASVTTGSTTGLHQQHRIRNMYNSSNSCLQIPPRQTQLNISSGSRIMDNTTMNYMANQRKRRSLLTNMDSSPYNVVQPEDARMLGEDIRSAKRPCNSWFLQNYFASSWNRSTRELGSSHCASDNTTAQNFEQINSATAAATVLEKISHDLFDGVDIEPAGVAEEAMVMSRVNSLSELLQQDPAPATASRSSQGSYADATVTIANPLNISAESATTQVLGVAPDAGSSGGSCNQAGGNSNKSLSPSTTIIEGLSCEEEEQMGKIEMDQAYLSEMLPFCP